MHLVVNSIFLVKPTKSKTMENQIYRESQLSKVTFLSMFSPPFFILWLYVPERRNTP